MRHDTETETKAVQKTLRPRHLLFLWPTQEKTKSTLYCSFNRTKRSQSLRASQCCLLLVGEDCTYIPNVPYCTVLSCVAYWNRFHRPSVQCEHVSYVGFFARFLFNYNLDLDADGKPCLAYFCFAALRFAFALCFVFFFPFFPYKRILLCQNNHGLSIFTRTVQRSASSSSTRQSKHRKPGLILYAREYCMSCRDRLSRACRYCTFACSLKRHPTRDSKIVGCTVWYKKNLPYFTWLFYQNIFRNA